MGSLVGELSSMSGSLVDSSKSGASLVLQHPNGGQVYLVGVAHVSAQAAQEVKDVIQTVSPKIVVLELDQERYDKLQQAASAGDLYGIKRHLNYGALQPFVVALSGDVLEYMLSLAYVVGGALLGSPAGGEFLAAKEAAMQTGDLNKYTITDIMNRDSRLEQFSRQSFLPADYTCSTDRYNIVSNAWHRKMPVPPGGGLQVGAEIVLGDRDQRTTMQRMTAMAAKYRRGVAMEQPAAQQRAPRNTSSQGKALQTEGSDSAQSSTLGSASDYASSASNMLAGASNNQQHDGPNEAWGSSGPQGSNDNPIGNIVQDLAKQPGAALDPDRWNKILAKGGCNNGQAVVDAFGRMLKQGSSKGAVIDTQDLLMVRHCGVTMLENFRQQALQAGDDGMKQVEDEAMMGLKGMAGMDTSREAMHEVLGHERDLILARRLWEAGERSEGQGVVGVVGAAHVKGIQARWEKAGSPETAKQVAEYCGNDAMALPTQAGPWINLAAAAGIGLLAWRRPRFAKITAAVGAVVVAPYLVFTTPVISRYQHFAQNIVTAAEKLQQENGMAFEDSPWSNGSKS